MEISLEIAMVDNGFILKYPEEIEDGYEFRRDVIECDGLEKVTMTNLLEYVAEHFSTEETRENKFKKENLRISWDRWGSHAE